MPFQKGKEKTGGRVKNQPNKTSKEIRDASMLILSGQIETLENLSTFLSAAIKSLAASSILFSFSFLV